MTTVMALVNSKGGVGKTTGVYNIAGILSENSKVLILDFDKQRNSTYAFFNSTKTPENSIYDVFFGKSFDEAVEETYFRHHGNANPKYFNVDIIAGDVRMKNDEELSKIDGESLKERFYEFVDRVGYDWVLVDMPANSSALDRICFNHIASYILTPFTSDEFSVMGYGDLINSVHAARTENISLNIVGAYLSRFSPNLSFDNHIKEETINSIGDYFINVQIPQTADIKETIAVGRPINYYKGKNNESRKAFELLVEKIKERVETLNNQEVYDV